MKKGLLLVTASLSLTACSFAARSPEMYRDDTKAALESKNAEILGCYDGVLKATPGAQGKVTIKFEVETETGKFVNISVDKAASTAPDAVGECVTKAVGSLAIKPPDARTGQATWTYDFAAPPPPAAAPKS